MKLRLTTRIVLFFVFLSAMLLTSVGVLAYRSGNESLKAAAISEMLAAAVEKEAALDTWIEERLDDIVQISGPADVAEKAATLIAAPPASEAARSAHAVLLQELEPHLVGLHCPYLELFVLEPESAKVMASTSPAQEGKFKLGHPYFDNGKKGLYLQAPYYSAEMAAPAMTAAIPLRGADGRVVAVLAARLDLAALNTIAQRRTGLRQTDDSFLFNAEQFPVTQPRFIHEPVVLRRKLDTEAIRLGVARHSGVILVPDYRGVPSIAVYRWSARRQLGLIVKIDQAEALAPTRAFGWMVARISGLALLVAVGLAFLMARTITRPLCALHDGVRRFAEGNFQQPLLESSGDEVGLLAGEFNVMAARVAERTADLARVNEALEAEIAVRKRAEEASHASQQLIEGIITAMPGGVFWKDRNLVFMGCNAAFARDAGFADPKDIIGKDDYQMVWRAQAELYRGDDRQVIESGCAKLLIEEPHTTAEGNTITLLTSKTPLRNSQGEVSGVIGMYMDITARKQTEEALCRTSELLVRTGELAKIGGWELDLRSMKLFWSLETCRIHAVDPPIAPALDQAINFYAPEARPVIRAAVQAGIETGAPFDLDLPLTTANGRPIWVRAQGSAVMKDGKAVKLIGAFQDITERKRTAEALRQSEEQFRAMFDLAPVGVAQADPQTGQWLRVNKKMCEITGYSAIELLQLRVPDITYPEERQLDWEAFERVVRGEAPDYRMEKRYIRKDGALAWVNVNMTVIRDAAGQPTRTVAAIEDITERKQAAEALRASQQFIKGILNAMPVRAFWKDRNLVYLGCNAVFARDAGFADPKDIIGKDDYQMGWRDQAELYRSDDRQVIESGCAKLLIEEPHTTPEGNTITMLTSKIPLRGSNGEVSGVLGTYMDITERKRTETALRESDARYHRLFAGSPDGILVADIETKTFKYANPAMSRMLGYSEDELRTMGVLDIHPKDAVQSVVADFEAQVRGDKTLSTNIPCLRKDGSVVHADINATKITIDNRPCTVGFFRDITERRRAQAELEDLQRQLVDASREAGMAEIATSVLHNVGNVLNSINVSTGLVAESVKKSRASSLGRVVVLLQEHAHDLGAFITQDSKGKHVPAHLAQLAEHLQVEQETNVRELELLRHNVDHIKEIVAMQQTYATFGGVKEMINVVHLVEDSLRINEGALSRHEVEVVREFESVPTLNVEKHKILQILVNLLRNAKYACDDSERADKRLTVRVANGEGRVRISVIDNGVGIPPENLTRIFNHGFTTRKDGHGFGLHSSALAAKEMGGSLTVHSDGPGQGAEFTLELPCNPPNMATFSAANGSANTHEVYANA
jgi:PAS domain S-box-containing protein